MTNQEAIERIQSIKSKVSLYDDVLALRMAEEALEKTRWIPVSERLPEEDGCYLVTTTGTNNDIIDIAYYTDGIWHKASRIKVWMPLPQPYRAIEALENQKEGRWKKISPAGIYECTCCGQDVMTSDIECYKFCHRCGARMEEIKQ